MKILHFCISFSCGSPHEKNSEKVTLTSSPGTYWTPIMFGIPTKNHIKGDISEVIESNDDFIVRRNSLANVKKKVSNMLVI